MKGLVLQRTLEVRCWHVIGQIAKASKRSELLPLLLRARERGHTTVNDIAEHLLFEPRSRRVVAERLLHIAERYGLLERNERGFALTEAGTAAVVSERVFVPERGTWTIWAAKDPLLEHPVLRVEPWREPAARDEVRNQDVEHHRRESVNVPPTLRSAIGPVATPPVGDGTPVRIDELAHQAEAVDSDASLRIVWSVADGSLRLEGSLDGVHVSTALAAPRVPTVTVWRQLLESEGLWPRWDDGAKTLCAGFAETTERERESMRRDLEFLRPTLTDLGQFDPVTVGGIVLRAATAHDAARWAAWRLSARVREYATSDRFGIWSSEATFPFTEFSPAIPSRQQLAVDAWRARGERPTTTAWHLIAAEDWSL